MKIKIKVKKNILTKLYFRQFYITRNSNYRGLFVDKGSGSGIFPDPDPGDPKRPDPDPQHWLKHVHKYSSYSICIRFK